MRRKARLTDPIVDEVLLERIETESRPIGSAVSGAWRDARDDTPASVFDRAAAARATPPELVGVWRNSYLDAGVELSPVWDRTQLAGAQLIKDGALRNGISFDWEDFDARVPVRTEARLTSWVETMTASQARAFDAVYAASGELADGDVAFLLRESTGLDQRQARALVRSRAAMIEDEPGINRTRLQAALTRQADTLRRTRRRRIARLEVTDAFNAGSVDAAGELSSSGVLPGPVTVIWVDQGDSKVCPICAPLDGLTVSLGSDFTAPTLPGPRAHPPAHHGCRCVVRFEVES